MICLKFVLFSLFLVLYNASPTYDLKPVDHMPATCRIVRSEGIRVTSVEIQGRIMVIDENITSIESSTLLFLSGNTLTMAIGPASYVMVGGTKYTSSERHTITIKGGEQVLIAEGSHDTSVAQHSERNSDENNNKTKRYIAFVVEKRMVTVESRASSLNSRKGEQTNSNSLRERKHHCLAATTPRSPTTVASEPNDETSLTSGVPEPTITKINLSAKDCLLGGILKRVDGSYAAQVDNNAIGYLMSVTKTKSIRSGESEELLLYVGCTHVLLLAEATEDSKPKAIHFMSLLVNFFKKNLDQSTEDIIAIAKDVLKHYETHPSYKGNPDYEMNFALSMAILTNKQAEECTPAKKKIYRYFNRIHLEYLSQEQQMRQDFNLSVGNYDAKLVGALNKISPNIFNANDKLFTFADELIELAKKYNETVTRLKTTDTVYKQIPLHHLYDHGEQYRALKAEGPAALLRHITKKTTRDMKELIEEGIDLKTRLNAKIAWLEAKDNTLGRESRSVNPQYMPTSNGMGILYLISNPPTEHPIIRPENLDADPKNTAKTSRPSIITARLAGKSISDGGIFEKNGQYFAHVGPNTLGYLISENEEKVVPSNEPEELTSPSKNKYVLLLAKPAEETKLKAVHFLALLTNQLKRCSNYSAGVIEKFAKRIIEHYTSYGPYYKDPRYKLHFDLSISIISRKRQSDVEKIDTNILFSRIFRNHLDYLYQEQQIRKAFGLQEGNYDESLLRAVLRLTNDIQEAKKKVTKLALEIHQLVLERQELAGLLREKKIEESPIPLGPFYKKTKSLRLTFGTPQHMLRGALGIKSQDMIELINKGLRSKDELVAENNRLKSLLMVPT